MAEVLRCTDRWGRESILMNAQWMGHILVKHDEMIDGLGAIRQTIEQPDFVNHDLRNRHGENFYLFGALPAPLNRSYLKVCIRFTFIGPLGPWRGEIVTAYATTAVKTGEVQKWP